MPITSYLTQHSRQEIIEALREYQESLLPEDPDRQQLDATTPEDYLADYERIVEKWTPEIPRLVQHFNQWLTQNHYTPSQAITEQLPVVFYDWNIVHALDIDEDQRFTNHLTSLVLSRYSEETSILGQISTMASYDATSATAGYTRIQSNSILLSATEESNQWFNGGVNLITQELLSKPEEFTVFMEQQKSAAYLHWYTRRVIQELALPEHTILAGYFSAGNERGAVREAIEKRFGTTLEQLRHFYLLPISEDMRLITEEVLSGKPVTLKYPKTNRELELIYTETARLFPNVQAEAV